MSEIERLQQLAGIVKHISEDEGSVEKTAIGHTDNEREMLRKEIFQMGTYCVELFKMVSELPEDADLPHWWQSKIVRANEFIGAAKHYLENEIQVPGGAPEIPPELADDNDPSGVS
jgi:hypothetical protein